MDNITAPAIGARIATDEIGGIHYPMDKVGFGPDGSFTRVTEETPLPAHDAALLAAVQALLPGTGTLPAGAATDAKLELIRLLLATPVLPSGAATQATLASVLAKMIAAPATESKQDAMLTALAATLKVQTPTPAGVVAGQLAVTANAAAAALPAAALVNGIVVKASASNTATVFVGGSNLATGVGGYPLAPGEAMSFSVANASALYFISTAASVVYFGGN